MKFLGVATVQNIAYDEPAHADGHDVARLRSAVEAGGVVALARVRRLVRRLGLAGQCTTPIDGVTEVAAIGVVPEYRRRGVAGAVTSLLVRAAFAAGVTAPFLMPTRRKTGMRIYVRAGFERVSEIMISGPR
ncbi:MAG: hypothetical protein U0841_25440 [Chloroflexia bacterium]